MRRIAITGASGFIGQHVIKRLAEAYPQTSLILVGRDANRLRSLCTRSRVVEMDLYTSGSGCYAKLGSPDVLLHLAWGGLPNYRSLRHFETELPQQYRFLRTMVRGGLGTLLVTGTCFEYGMQCGQLDETMPTAPENPYGFAKDSLRRQLEFLKDETPFSFTWARLFYLFGENQASSSLFGQLKRAVQDGEPQFKMSGGEQLRDYMNVTDVATVLCELAARGADLGVVNVCSGKPVSIRRLVESWLESFHWSIELKLGHYPYPDYEPMAFWGSNRKLSGFLGQNSSI